MTRQKFFYIFFTSLIAFAVWIAGEVVIIYNGLSMTLARIWIVAVFITACAWSLVHFYRVERKAKEDKENDDYKGVY